MKLDDSQVYSLPLIMGPIFERETRPGRVYGEVESLAATFKTDRDAVIPLVPDCYAVPTDATVTISFGDYNRVDFMAGDGYRVGYVGVSAGFRGELAVDGLCILVMWENRTVPIVSGREMIGIPKLAADITSIREVDDGTLHATASVWGHEMLRIEAEGFHDQNAMVRRTAQKRVNSTPWLGYKYIPSFDGPPDASYPMVVWNEVKLEHLQFADHASIGFGQATKEDVAQLAGITRSLRTLPLGDLVFATHARGSAELRLDRSHRLF
jgi:acetoacetate decarboxylase